MDVDFFRMMAKKRKMESLWEGHRKNPRKTARLLWMFPRMFKCILCWKRNVGTGFGIFSVFKYLRWTKKQAEVFVSCKERIHTLLAIVNSEMLFRKKTTSFYTKLENWISAYAKQNPDLNTNLIIVDVIWTFYFNFLYENWVMWNKKKCFSLFAESPCIILPSRK